MEAFYVYDAATNRFAVYRRSGAIGYVKTERVAREIVARDNAKAQS